MIQKERKKIANEGEKIIFSCDDVFQILLTNKNVLMTISVDLFGKKKGEKSVEIEKNKENQQNCA